MADRMVGGSALDARSAKIKERKLMHEIGGLRRSIDEQEIRILEAEMQIERFRETIAGTKEQIAKKEAELEAFKKEMSNG